MTSNRHAVASTADAQRWDGMYSSDPERVWSGAPNGSLVVEVADLPAGRVLDVGCGEGADAIWLAQRGWRVTAVDISAVAVERARAAGAAAGTDVDWRCIDLLAEPPRPATYDLVSLQYPALVREVGVGPFRDLLAAVAPGGTMLVVGHAHVEDHQDHDHHSTDHDDPGDGHEHDGEPHEGLPDDDRPRFDPAEFFGIDELRTLLLDAGFDIEVDEVRPRPDPPPDARHVEDTVLRARRPTGT